MNNLSESNNIIGSNSVYKIRALLLLLLAATTGVIYYYINEAHTIVGSATCSSRNYYCQSTICLERAAIWGVLAIMLVIVGFIMRAYSRRLHEKIVKLDLIFVGLALLVTVSWVLIVVLMWSSGTPNCPTTLPKSEDCHTALPG